MAKLQMQAIIIIIIIIIIKVYCYRPFLPGTSLEPAVIPTAQASSFTLQYFPYCVMFQLLLLLLLLLLLYDMDVSCYRPFLPGTSLKPAVIPTAQASSFTLQYFRIMCDVPIIIIINIIIIITYCN